jgi:hypothetical protein
VKLIVLCIGASVETNLLKKPKRAVFQAWVVKETQDMSDHLHDGVCICIL